MGWRESLAGKVGNPVTQIIVKIHDEATLLAVEGVPDAKSNTAAVTVAGKVWRLYDISKE